ncbi:Inner spore coat protein H [Peribacillus sp. Bi96]|nr:Inner spore coat protein H [Peribacillus sp. Bi96]
MSYHIPSYFLTIEEDDLEDLRADVWSNDPIPAYLKVENDIFDIDIAYRGSYTRKFRKRSYWIDFIEPERFFDAHKIHLNAEYRDPSLIRNKLSLDFFQDLGVLSPNSQHINLYRNGSCKGVYLQLDSVDEFFLEKRGLPAGPIYYAVNNHANFSLERDGKPKDSLVSGYKQAFGKPDDDEFLIELIKKINTTPLAKFPEIISQHLDIHKYLHWLVGAVCTMNNDGFTHNYALYRNSETKLFEVIPWDYDATWGRKVSGGIMEHTYVPIGGKQTNHLNNLLLKVPEYRKFYKDLLVETMETTFTVDYMENKVLSLHQGIRPHILLDPYKKNKVDLFDKEPEFIFEFIRKRSDYLNKHLGDLDETKLKAKQDWKKAIEAVSPICIKNTGKYGRGIYATRDIKKDELIEASPVIFSPKSEWKYLKKTSLFYHCFHWGDEDTAIALGNGSLFNHSYTPNATFDNNLEDVTIDFYAHEDIKAGEEITINYNGEIDDKSALWFDVIE